MNATLWVAVAGVLATLVVGALAHRSGLRQAEASEKQAEGMQDQGEAAQRQATTADWGTYTERVQQWGNALWLQVVDQGDQIKALTERAEKTERRLEEAERRAAHAESRAAEAQRRAAHAEQQAAEAEERSRANVERYNLAIEYIKDVAEWVAATLPGHSLPPAPPELAKDL